MMEAYAFYPLALLTIVAALVVVSRKNPVHSVLALVICFIGVAAIYIVLHAEFLAAVQILVYAGGIVVLYLFVVMLVSLRQGETAKTARHRLPAIILAVMLFAELIVVFVRATPSAAQPSPVMTGSATQALGRVLLVEYLLPFEIASLLLLVAMIGAIVLAKKRV
ncbi:MAG: NADH-quinone oxidoreductase subunit J [Acidobacteriota bacterium]